MKRALAFTSLALCLVAAARCGGSTRHESAVRDASTPGSSSGGGSGSDDGGADAEASREAMAACAFGAQQCTGDGGVATCGATGQWGTPWPCASGACSGGACTQPTGGEPPSCTAGGPGMTNCGASGAESCCASLEVPGGTYFRTYENDGGSATGEADPATVSGFRLDKYEVTVGRFRQFVNAWDAGWTPAPGSGKHTHLNGGLGLANSAIPETFELGWVASDDASAAPSTCGLGDGTWTFDAGAGDNENQPVNCLTWYSAYAFCIWDGGFLPSEAEWERTASGGSEQREYPWGATDPTFSPNQYAVYGCNYDPRIGIYGPCWGPPEEIANVGTAALGASAWGQLDIGGNLAEWAVDYLSTYSNPCVNCGSFNASSTSLLRVFRGGGYDSPLAWLWPSYRTGGAPGPIWDVGGRCARTP